MVPGMTNESIPSASHVPLSADAAFVVIDQPAPLDEVVEGIQQEERISGRLRLQSAGERGRQPMVGKSAAETASVVSPSSAIAVHCPFAVSSGLSLATGC